VESPLADDLAHAEIQVHTGREGDIHPVRPQFRGHEPAERARERDTCARIHIELVTDAACGRQKREPCTEALHAAALLVDRDDERRRAQRVY
jgi:hypothetical protein